MIAIALDEAIEIATKENASHQERSSLLGWVRSRLIDVAPGDERAIVDRLNVLKVTTQEALELADQSASQEESLPCQ